MAPVSNRHLAEIERRQAEDANKLDSWDFAFIFSDYNKKFHNS